MNLLTDTWIPVIRKDGSVDEISPLSLLEDPVENPVVAVHTVRPDFDGALIQFLIGVYQVLLSPSDEEEWYDLLESPPLRTALEKKIELMKPAFEVDTGNYRFMQDLSVKDTDEWDIPKLLIDINNTHFIKEGTIQHMCPKCAAMALLTLELNSPSGGRGHLTSLRGGGPLTTLNQLPIDQRTLWKSIILNIIPESSGHWHTDCTLNSETLRSIFPWISEMPNSDSGDIIVPKDMHPYHVYWNVPRRIYLNTSDTEPGTCDICGMHSENLLKQYWSRPNGIKYDSWSHPLTPYYLKKDKAGDMLLPVRGKEGGVTYANWIGLVLSSSDLSRISAKVISEIPELLYGNNVYSDLKVHAFGYAMDNAKARVWQDGVLPTYRIPAELKRSFSAHVTCLVSAASDILYYLIGRIKDGLTKDSKNLKGDFTDVGSEFWSTTETAFYTALMALPEAIQADNSISPDCHNTVDIIKQEWVSAVRNICLSIFRNKVEFPISGGSDPSLVAKAEIALRNYLTVTNPKLCKILNLPVPEKKMKSKVKS